MRARPWMIGCLLGLAGVGGAMASDLGAHDLGASAHSAAGGCLHDSGSANGGDSLGSGRDCTASRRGSDANNGDAENQAGGGVPGGERDGRLAAPAAKPAMLGWQSLLPGSIQ